jgi:RNA binding exosome subunit
MKQQVNIKVEDLEQYYSQKIAALETQLAREQAAKKAVISYAEELEAKVDELEAKGNGESTEIIEGEEG